MLNAFLGGVMIGFIVSSVGIAIVAMLGIYADERRKL
jgi:hypothetical protein